MYIVDWDVLIIIIRRQIVDEEEEGSEDGESDLDDDGVNLEESDEETH